MYQDLANVLFWGYHKSMFINWYQLPTGCGSEIAPSYVVDHESTPGMLLRTNPPLACYGERIHPWYATDHESLVLWWNCWFWKKISLGQNHRKKSGSRKSWGMGIPKKTFKNPRKIKFFFWPQHSPGFRWSRLFSMKLRKKTKTKSILWRPVVCSGERCYATGNDSTPWYAPEHESTPGMLRITNPPLVCYRSRTYPWYAKDHACQQSQNSPTHVGYGSQIYSFSVLDL